MTRRILISLAVLVVAAAAALFWLIRGPDASQFADLKEPRFTRLNDQRMLVVDATGDPNVVGQRAFKQLFKAYYALDGVSRVSRPPAPRARWAHPDTTAKANWIGHYALPVSDDAALPATADADALPMAIWMWSYGDVAEVLHVGSYSSEETDIRRLLEFVRTNGYRPIGDHEEEYVRGPGMIFAGNPDTYLTIIRLRVEKDLTPDS